MQLSQVSLGRNRLPLRPRTMYVGVSSKMYMGYQDTLVWLAGLRQEVDARPALKDRQVVPFVIPSFPMLAAAGEILSGSPVILGAQDCGWADGPWTGEVSPSLLAELGVSFVEIGHAERRRYFAEDDSVIALKVRAADAAGLTPLLCVGEDTKGEASTAAATVYQQIDAAVGGDWNLAARLVIAFEPVWAIGAAEPADTGYVNDVIAALRGLLSSNTLGQMPIIYGGSAKPGLLPRLDAVSGLFLGRFAHDATKFGSVLDEALALSADHPWPRS